jgi:inner membrane protein
MGLVRIEREEWRAESVDGAAIPVGAAIRVVRVDGTRLIVKAEPPAAGID